MSQPLKCAVPAAPFPSPAPGAADESIEYTLKEVEKMNAASSSAEKRVLRELFTIRAWHRHFQLKCKVLKKEERLASKTVATTVRKLKVVSAYKKLEQATTKVDSLSRR